MKLVDLLADVEGVTVSGARDIAIERLEYDSRRVRAGDLFFALPGLKQDGAAFVDDAIARGAVAAVTSAAIERPSRTVVHVADVRRAMAEVAATFYGHPSRALRVVGVTGTNGKTTTTYLLESVFVAAGWRAGVIGTTGARIDGEARPLGFTTPEAPELQALLRDMVDRGVAAVALEISSHALVQRRAFGLDEDVAVFTNLSHDHLDYHGTMAGYLDAKQMLFDGRNAPRARKPRVAVVNLDDARAEAVLEAARTGRARVVTYGATPRADVRIDALEIAPTGLRFTLADADARTDVALPLLGRYNAWNAAAAFGAARALDVPAATIADGLARVAGVPGRLEPVNAGQPFSVVVDYAHSPDALERTLAACRDHARGRVLVVFGCGGDRDRAKRPVMGRAAEALADRVWVTSDNPRSEDPAAIAAEVVAGMTPGVATVVLDRREAIAAALAAARSNDLVLIAGKGHETTQTIGDRVLPFDDREVARALLAGGAWDGR